MNRQCKATSVWNCAVMVMVVAAVALGLQGPASAQCSHWEPVGGNVGSRWVIDTGSGPEMYGYVIVSGSGHSAIARWNGASWTYLVDPAQGWFNEQINGLCSYDDGTGLALYASGRFTEMDVNHQIIRYVSKWSGTQWTFIGPPIQFPVNQVGPMAVFDDGSGPALYVAGFFNTAGLSDNIVRLKGTVWESVGGGLPSFTNGLCAFDDGSGNALFTSYVEFSGSSYVGKLCKWTAGGWTTVLSGFTWNGGSPTSPWGLAVYDHGMGLRLFMAGIFDMIGGVVAPGYAEWDGSTLFPVSGAPHVPAAGSGVNLALHDDGTGPALYVQTGYSLIDRWDGHTWSVVGAGGENPQSF
ncbi:MAG: hypothetical protein IPJ19_14100, partial [Planctomycetes bacterium]|nr:hypothetical protein [Planctomycetota bacterium]